MANEIIDPEEAIRISNEEDDPDDDPLGEQYFYLITGRTIDQVMASDENEIENQKFYNRGSFNKWRIDDDGFLRITICLLKEGIFEYGPEEFPEFLPELQGPGNNFKYYI